MSMSCRTPPKRLRFAFWAFDPEIMRMKWCFEWAWVQFLRRGSALHFCSSSEEVLLYTCAVPPKRFCFALVQFLRRGSASTFAVPLKGFCHRLLYSSPRRGYSFIWYSILVVKKTTYIGNKQIEKIWHLYLLQIVKSFKSKYRFSDFLIKFCRLF